MSETDAGPDHASEAEAEASAPQPEPPVAAGQQQPPELSALAKGREEKAPEVSLEEEEPDDDRPLGERLADENRERRLRDENLDGLYATRTVHGSAHRIMDSTLFETHHGDINIGLRDSGPIVRTYPVGDEDARRIRDTFVDGDARKRLVEQLHSERVVVLAGHADSGREYTAQAALLWWAYGSPQEESRRTALLMVSGDPAYVKADSLRRRTGYVLDATRAAWARQNPQEVLRHLDHLADVLSGCFVVLTGPDGLFGQPSVRHDPPEPVEVFERWLKYELTRLDHGGLFETAYQMDGLADFAAEKRPPGESARLARESAAVLCGGGRLDDVMAGQPGELKKAARERLGSDHPLHLRCFLISAAVLNELPVITVSRAASLLVELVGDEPSAQEQPDAPTWQWLPDWLDHAWADCDEADDTSGIRRVRLRRPHLAAAVLEVVWQEGQSIRDPVLAWLRELSRHPGRDVRIKVAHAIGRLATYDFDVIDTEFLRPWSGGSSRQSEQWLAAWAFEAVAHAEKASGRVLDRLRGWSEGTAKQRTVVARAYGSRIGVDWIEEALAAFQRISLRSSPKQRYIQDAVARSLTEVYGRETAPAILGELSRWIEKEHPGLRRTAALTLTRLASEVGGQRSRLQLDELDDELWQETERQLVELWLNALSCGLTPRNLQNIVGGPPVHEAWTALAAWVGDWEKAPERRRSVIEKVFAAGRGDLRGPLQLHLHHWFRRKTISAELSRHLYHLMKGGVAR
ncbi:hypothetical protein [Streptosporangium sp. NPDC002721]|uniref:hypothetical protein n=1 Tax=Streptosporangium sp. NPDC002721 TaxID=3366188 RepID=UPI00367DF3B3